MRKFGTTVSKWQVQDSHPSRPVCPHLTSLPTVHTNHGEWRQIKQNLTATFKLPPSPFPWFRCPKGQVTNQTLLLSCPPHTHNTFRGKAKDKALPQPLIISHPEEYFHDLSLQTNSGRRNTPLCNVRGQATRGRESGIHKDINLPFDILSVSVFCGLHFHDWLFKRGS